MPCFISFLRAQGANTVYYKVVLEVASEALDRERKQRNTIRFPTRLCPLLYGDIE